MGPKYSPRATNSRYCAVIEGESSTEITLVNGRKVPLPPLEGTTITFIISTNADKLLLNLGGSRADLTVTEATLDRNMEIDVLKLTVNKPSEKRAWMQLVTETIRKGVAIKFLFTRSAGRRFTSPYKQQASVSY